MEQNGNTLSERMKELRGRTDYLLDEDKDIMIMIDGHNFSKNVKNLFVVPFSDIFAQMMNQTAIYVAKNLQGCKFAYVQSDEITFYVKTNKELREEQKLGSIIYGGRLCKIQSIVAGMATKFFNYLLTDHIRNKNYSEEYIVKHLIEFDCKAWNVNSMEDVYSYLIWRQNDCIRNSKQQFAQAYCSHEELIGKNTDEQIELVLKKTGKNWYKFDEGFKYGRFIIRENKNMLNPNGEEFTRHIWQSIDGWKWNSTEMRQSYNDCNGEFWKNTASTVENFDKYEALCNDIAEMVNKRLFDGKRKWYWIGEEIGGICDFEDTDFINMAEMLSIIKYNVTFDEYNSWHSYSIDEPTHSFSLRSWIAVHREKETEK